MTLNWNNHHHHRHPQIPLCKFTNLKVLNQEANTSNVPNVWQYQSCFRNPDKIILLAISAALSHFCLLHPFFSLCLDFKFYIPLKVCHPVFTPAHVEASCCGETSFQWWQAPLKIPPWFLYCRRIQLLQPGHLVFSALMKAVAIGRYYKFVSFLPALTCASSSFSRIRNCLSNSSSDVAGEGKDHPIQEQKGNHHSCWSWACLLQSNA